jgi:hypothetical protein
MRSDEVHKLGILRRTEPLRFREGKNSILVRSSAKLHNKLHGARLYSVVTYHLVEGTRAKDE